MTESETTAPPDTQPANCPGKMVSDEKPQAEGGPQRVAIQVECTLAAPAQRVPVSNPHLTAAAPAAGRSTAGPALRVPYATDESAATEAGGEVDAGEGRVLAEAGGGAAAEAAAGKAARAYEPRPAPHTPYLQRKIRALQAQVWEGAAEDVLESDMKRHRGRVQRDQEQALASAAGGELDENELSVVRRVVHSAFQAAIAADGGSLGIGLLRHSSLLQREQAAAAAAAAAAARRTPSPQPNLPHFMQPTTSSAKKVLALDEVLVARKSRLELEKEAARARNSPKVNRRGSQVVTLQVAAEDSLDRVLVKRRSALEMEKEAAAAAGAAGRGGPPQRGAAPRRARADPWQGQGLDQVIAVQFKSQLELDKEAAAKAAPPRGCAAKAAPAEAPLEQVLVVRRSRLELEKAAAEEAARKPAQRTPPPSARAALAWQGKGLAEMVATQYRSQLELDKAAAANAAADSGSASNRRTTPTSELLKKRQSECWEGQSLWQVQVPHKSRLQREKEAWALAEDVMSPTHSLSPPSAFKESVS